MNVSKRVYSILLLVPACGMLLVLCTFQLPGENLLAREIHNTGHTPVFGLLALTLLGLSRLILGNIMKNDYKHYVAAFILTISIGALIEYIQIFGQRDADIWDLVRDMAGSFSFLGFYASADRRIRHGLTRGSRIAVRLASIIVLLAALTPLTLCSGAYLHRNAIFPKLLTFDSVWETRFLTTRNAELGRVPPPDGFTVAEGQEAGRLTMVPDTYCGFRIAEPYPDWSGFSYLRVDVWNELDSAITLMVRIDDIHHNQEYEDRYNGTFRITPGLNHISVDLREVRHAPSSREMDMTAIEYIYFFTFEPKEPIILYFDQVELQ
jgi:hypothetical protein